MSDSLDIGRVVEKKWGKEIWIVNGPLYCGKKLIVNPGWRCSKHRHLHKDETFYVESGYGWIMLDDEPVRMLPGTVLRIPPGTWHCFWNACKVPFILMEISTHHDDADVERANESAPLKEPLKTLEGGAQ